MLKNLFKICNLVARTSADRGKDDLGRFGSGMKAASFSQARKLTVISENKNSKLAGAIWDIDKIEQTNSWILEKLDSHEIKSIMDRLMLEINGDSGTILIWEKIDTLTGNQEDKHRATIPSVIPNLKDFLALHFHKFLDSKYNAPKAPVKILINDVELKSIDPF